MTKVIIIMLVVLFMGCALTEDVNYLEDSWYFEEGETFTNYVFGDKFIITEITGGIRGTIVYDYYVDGDDIYILLNDEYVKTYHIEGLTDRELKLYSYVDGESTLFLRD